MRKIFVLGGIAALCLVSAQAQAADGQKLFLDNCAACHRPTGTGVPGAFPALAGSKVAVGDPKEPIGRVLNGKGGMPSFKAELSDADVAAVLTYVRGAWGNKAKPVAETQVASMRGGGAAKPKVALQAH